MVLESITGSSQTRLMFGDAYIKPLSVDESHLLRLLELGELPFQLSVSNLSAWCRADAFFFSIYITVVGAGHQSIRLQVSETQRSSSI